jgi:hypothetical protein
VLKFTLHCEHLKTSSCSPEALGSTRDIRIGFPQFGHFIDCSDIARLSPHSITPDRRESCGCGDGGATPRPRNCREWFGPF